MLWFAGAALAQHVFDEMQELSVQACGERILFSTGFGSTETAPFALARTWPTDNAANMGLPGAGMELKLVPNEGKLEARVRGPNITPGYWRQPDYTAKPTTRKASTSSATPSNSPIPTIRNRACCSTAASPRISSSPPAPGCMSARCARSFIDHCAPYVRDVVIAGEGRDDIAVLVFPNLDACRDAVRRPAADAAPDDDRRRCAACARISRRCSNKLALASTGSSTRV